MMLGFAIMTAFVPGIIGATSNTSWAVMWLAMPLLLLNCKMEITLIHILGLIFLSYAALSLLWSPHGLLELMQLLALASVFVWGFTLKDLRKVTISLAFGLAVSSIVAVLQFSKVDLGILTTSKLTGLFINPNIYAEVSGMLLVLILVYKLWWLIPTTIPGLLVSSRAVAIALGVSLAMFVWKKSKLLSVLIVLASCFIAFNLSMVGDTLHSEAVNTKSINIRFGIWQDMLYGFTLFGKGIGSFVYLFPEYNKHLDVTINLAEYAHNDLLQLIFELGIGTIPLVLIMVYLLKINNEHRNVLVFFIIIGLFGFPLHMPVTGFMVALVAAQLAKFSLGNRLAINSSRPILFSRMETA